MCSRGSVRVTHTARPVPPHPLQEDDLSEFPACTAPKYSSTESARFPSAVHTWSGSGTVLPDLPHLMTFRKQDSGHQMKAPIFVVAGVMLLSPTFCQSGERFSYFSWGRKEVLVCVTDSNLLCISHKLQPKRQSSILHITRWRHGSKWL